jgi:hypothetical protein
LFLHSVWTQISQSICNFTRLQLHRVDAREFIVSVTAVLGSSRAERVAVVFELYDDDGNGELDRDELTNLLKANYLTTNDAMVTRKVEAIMRQADLDRSGTIDREEFELVAERFPNLIFPSYAPLPPEQQLKPRSLSAVRSRRGSLEGKGGKSPPSISMRSPGASPGGRGGRGSGGGGGRRGSGGGASDAGMLLPGAPLSGGSAINTPMHSRSFSMKPTSTSHSPTRGVGGGLSAQRPPLSDFTSDTDAGGRSAGGGFV